MFLIKDVFIQDIHFINLMLMPTVTTLISSAVLLALSNTPCRFGSASSCSVIRSPSSVPPAPSLCSLGSSYTTRPGRSKGKPYRLWLLSRTTNHFCRTRTSKKSLSLTEESAHETKLLPEMGSRY